MWPVTPPPIIVAEGLTASTWRMAESGLKGLQQLCNYRRVPAGEMEGADAVMSRTWRFGPAARPPAAAAPFASAPVPARSASVRSPAHHKRTKSSRGRVSGDVFTAVPDPETTPPLTRRKRKTPPAGWVSKRRKTAPS